MHSTNPAPARNGIGFFLWALIVAAASLIAFSQTRAFVWDEGFHLLAAALIAQGKTVYVDFCFPQTPLNAYLNAFLFRWIGESWRVPHTAAAILTAGAITMTASYVYRRLEAPLE